MASIFDDSDSSSETAAAPVRSPVRRRAPSLADSDDDELASLFRRPGSKSPAAKAPAAKAPAAKAPATKSPPIVKSTPAKSPAAQAPAAQAPAAEAPLPVASPPLSPIAAPTPVATETRAENSVAAKSTPVAAKERAAPAAAPAIDPLSMMLAESEAERKAEFEVRGCGVFVWFLSVFYVGVVLPLLCSLCEFVSLIAFVCWIVVFSVCGCVACAPAFFLSFSIILLVHFDVCVDSFDLLRWFEVLKPRLGLSRSLSVLFGPSSSLLTSFATSPIYCTLL